MALGSLLLVGIHVQTRGNMREVLVGTHGQIRTDGQLRVVNEIMTRGLMISIGGLGVVASGVILASVGLVGFFVRRRKARNAPVSGAVDRL
ncbi:MAG: hypothetical protein O3A87_01720 [Verrucomicrobia bacterium]|nr:hypothetical protein [Verrucomicrobiota bacterium]MDA1005189.1 hypothetical protein [Verrucomicrobiota bacterium]